MSNRFNLSDLVAVVNVCNFVQYVQHCEGAQLE